MVWYGMVDMYCHCCQSFSLRYLSVLSVFLALWISVFVFELTQNFRCFYPCDARFVSSNARSSEKPLVHITLTRFPYSFFASLDFRVFRVHLVCHVMIISMKHIGGFTSFRFEKLYIYIYIDRVYM